MPGSLAWPLARGVPVQRQPCWCDVVIPAVVVVRAARPMSCVCAAKRQDRQHSGSAPRLLSRVWCAASSCFVLRCFALLCFALRCTCRFVVFQRRSRWRTHACTHARALDAHRAIQRTPSAAVDDIHGNIDSVDVAPRVSISLSLSLSLSAPGLAVVAHACCSHS
jgi:hypothetical protein